MYSRIAISLLMLGVCILWAHSIYLRYETFGVSQPVPEECLDELEKPFDRSRTLVGARGDIYDANTDNDDIDPWKRHKVNGSVLGDPVVKFKKAYYYELDNTQYITGLRKALTVSCSLISDAVNESNWSDSRVNINDRTTDAFAKNMDVDKDSDEYYKACVTEVDVMHATGKRRDPTGGVVTRNSEYAACVAEKVRAKNASSTLSKSAARFTKSDVDITSAYSACVDHIARRLNSSSDLDLPGENTKKIQVVHDVLRSYKIHQSEPSFYLIEIEMLLYRANKYHAKHVAATCTAKRMSNNAINMVINVVAVRILGVVPEDQIALFPVVASNPVDVDQLRVHYVPLEKVVDTSTPNFTCTADIESKKIKCSYLPNAQDVVDHATQYKKYAQSELALSSS